MVPEGGSRARFLVEKNISGNQNTRGEMYNDGEARFDNNMMVILAVLLFALVCALGVNTVVRCLLRCRRRMAPETGEGEREARGMKKDEMSQIPQVVFKSGQGLIPTAATDCPICLGEFKEGEVVRILPRCNHGFHVVCIDKWLLSHSSCPICRQLLIVSNV